MSMELLAAHEPPAAERARPVHLRAGMTGGEAFIEVARSCMTRVCTNAQRLRAGIRHRVGAELRQPTLRLVARQAVRQVIVCGWCCRFGEPNICIARRSRRDHDLPTLIKLFIGARPSPGGRFARKVSGVISRRY